MVRSSSVTLGVCAATRLNRHAAAEDAPRAYDLVIYGATGYTGCLCCEQLDALLSAPGSALASALASVVA